MIQHLGYGNDRISSTSLGRWSRYGSKVGLRLGVGALMGGMVLQGREGFEDTVDMGIRMDIRV